MARRLGLAALESHRVLPAVDAAAIVGAFLVVESSAVEPLGSGVALVFPVAALAAMFVNHAYAFRLRTNPLDNLGPVITGISIALVAVLAAGVVSGAGRQPPGALVGLWLGALVAIVAARTVQYELQQLARRRGIPGRRTLILGAGAVGARVSRRLAQLPGYGLEPVGFLDVEPPPPDTVGGRPVPVLGTPDDLVDVVASARAEHVVVAFSSCPDLTVASLVRRCGAIGVTVSVVPRLFESVNDRTAYEPVGGVPMLTVALTDLHGWQFAVKHAFDRVAAAAILALIAPLIAAIALAVKLDSPGPVLFRQRRVGRDLRPFDIFKFRTMSVAESSTAFVPVPGLAPGGVEGADRRTRVGRWLRRNSLDELPQLLNVLRGEMSLVGPRPERPEFVPGFSADLVRYGERHRVRSGITGLSQVSGLRGQCSLEDRIELDNFYIEHFSLALDLRILLMTCATIFHPAD